MLPTQNETELLRNTYCFTEAHGNPLSYGKIDNAIERGFEYQHLYIISDDKIEEGDWCLFFWDGNKEGELGQIGSEPQQYFPENGHTLNKNLRKIIATTDSELKLPYDGKTPISKDWNGKQLPQIPQKFIEEYCRKGGIDEVDVEYEKYHDGNFINDGKTHAFTALLRPKVSNDNIINIHLIKSVSSDNELLEAAQLMIERIKPLRFGRHEAVELAEPIYKLKKALSNHPIKDSWTVENLPDLLNRFCKDHSLHRGLQITDDMIKEWLEKQ